MNDQSLAVNKLACPFTWLPERSIGLSLKSSMHWQGVVLSNSDTEFSCCENLP